MKSVAPVVVSIAVWLAPALPARAATTLVDGPPACLSLGGQGDTDSCRVRNLIIEAADSVIVDAGITFVTEGTSFNYGHLRILGRFQNDEVFHNRGTLVNEGLMVPGHPVINTGTLLNRGWIHTHGQIDNRGTLENEALLETCAGAVVNYAYFRNAGDLENWGTLIVNEGVIVNDGYANNPDGSSYVVHNPGAFENRSWVYNGGNFVVPCGGAYYGEGTLDGVAIQYEACDAAAAARVLVTKVHGLSRPGIDSPSKNDVLALAGLLVPVVKGPPVLDADGQLALHEFIETVSEWEESGVLRRYQAAAFVGRAERILAMPPAQ